jgi:hypothetical protein
MSTLVNRHFGYFIDLHILKKSSEGLGVEPQLASLFLICNLEDRIRASAGVRSPKSNKADSYIDLLLGKNKFILDYEIACIDNGVTTVMLSHVVWKF